MSSYFIDVWQGDLRMEEANLPILTELLSDHEREKAECFKLPLLRNRYIAVRALLRRSLAAYLNVAPDGLRFELGEYGKPVLVGHSLHFNLSHAADHLLIAIADFAPVGVDIELVKTRHNLQRLAERCFSSRELADWRQLPATQQLPAFYRLWTKKEAFVKAVGRGIALGVQACEFDCVVDGRLIAAPDQYGPAAAWNTHELQVGEGVAAALVSPDHAYELRRLTL